MSGCKKFAMAVNDSAAAAYVMAAAGYELLEMSAPAFELTRWAHRLLPIG